MDLAATLVTLLAFALPGTLLWFALAGRPQGAEEAAEGLAVGLAGGLLLLRLAAETDLGLFTTAGAGLGAIGALALARTARGRLRPAGLSREGRLLLVLLLACLALRVVPLLLNPLPLGWDPYFHLLLAEKARVLGRAVHDWRPYEDIPLHYPIATHLLLAWASRLSGVALPLVFGAAQVLATLLTTALAFAAVSRASGSRELALQAAAAYGLWAVYGGLDYARWGGLPSALAMALMLALLSLALRPAEAGAWPVVGIALLTGAVAHSHHHGLVTLGLVFGAAWLISLTLRRDALVARRLGLGLAFGALLGAGPLIDHARRIPLAPLTGLDSYVEPAVPPVRALLGLGLAFSAAGLVGWRLARGRWRLHPLYLQVLGLLLALFVIGDWGVRLAAALWLRRDWAPFTPSRFLADAAVLLAVFPAVALLELARRRPRLVLPVLALGTLANARDWLNLTRSPVEPERLALYDCVRQRTAPETLVLDRWIFASYFTGRASSSLPLPSSELWALAARRQLGKAILAGAVPPSASPAPVVWLREPGQPQVGSVLCGDPAGLAAVVLKP